MKRLLTNNWILKLCSLLAAAVLWLVVVNDNDPLIPYPITNVPVTILNDQIFSDNDMVYRIEGGTTVNIKVQVRQTVIKQLSPSDFRLTADCMDWHPGFPTIPIRVEVVNHKSFYQNSNYELSTSMLKIEAEPLQSKTLNVEIKNIGQPAEGYTLGGMTCSPTQIEVKAPESVIKILSRAEATINIKGAMGEVQTVSELTLYDGNNVPIDLNASDVTLSDTSVNVSADVLKTKTVPVIVTNVTGRPADGYRYTEAFCSISSVEIAGPKAAVSGITGIMLDSDLLDVTGATENVHVSLDITQFLPSNVRLVNVESGVADVEMVVERLAEKQITFSAEEIAMHNTQEDLEYRLTQDVTITVTGLTEDLEILDATALMPYVDVVGLEPGTHTVALHIELPDIYELRTEPQAVLEIPEPEETSEQEDT